VTGSVPLEIVSIHHDCFVLRAAGRALLFDHPAPEHLPGPAAAALVPLVRGADLTVLISHSHADHFGPQVLDLARTARRVDWIVSYDVADLHAAFAGPELLGGAVRVAEPEEPLELRDLRVLPVESTDLGVGFCIEWLDRRIFFAGDVAEWDWGGADPAARAFARDFYAATLERIAAWLGTAPLDLALHNADARLANWAGALRFLRALSPRFFAPMHDFGDRAVPARFAATAKAEPGLGPLPEFLLFDAPGASREIDL
jgi:hypothetical protein